MPSEWDHFLVEPLGMVSRHIGRGSRRVGRQILEIAFFEFLSSRPRRGDLLKETFKTHITGGASITGATLAGALGRPLIGVGSVRRIALDAFELAAISFNTPGAPRAYQEAARLRAAGKIAIGGGPHASIRPDEAARYFDSVCIGPGDAAFPQMVHDAAQGRLKPLYLGVRGDWALPWRRNRRGLALLQTSRGCTSRCRFCSVPTLTPEGVDEKPIQSLETEVSRLPTFLSIVDDNFFAKPSRAMTVLDLLRKHGKRFICQISPADALQRETVAALAQSGCELVGVGIESVHPGSRAFLGKPADIDPAEVIEKIQSAGMACYLDLVFGADGETPAIFERTLCFVEEARPALVSPHLLTPFPGTALSRSFAVQGRMLFRPDAFPEAWARFDTRHVTFVPDPMRPEELERLFAGFLRDLFSLRRTIRRSRSGHLLMALVSSVLKNVY